MNNGIIILPNLRRCCHYYITTKRVILKDYYKLKNVRIV
jgi:hypothetical protein